MGATLYWTTLENQPLKNAGTSVAEALTRAFGDFPIALSMNHMDKLLGMEATWTGADNPYKALTDAIAEHGTIEVTAVY